MAFSRHSQRGDTLVEVLCAIVVLGIVIVGALTIMSRGLGQGQLAVEHSQVRLQVNGQIELLTYLRDQYIIDADSTGGQLWKAILDNTNTQPFVYDAGCSPTPQKISPNTTFSLAKDAVGNIIVKTAFDPSIVPTTHATPGKGLWVESRNATSTIDPPYVDFVIRACWPGSGGFATQRTVTAIRLYSPYDPLP